MTEEERQHIIHTITLYLWGKDVASAQVLAGAMVMAIDEYDKFLHYNVDDED